MKSLGRMVDILHHACVHFLLFILNSLKSTRFAASLLPPLSDRLGLAQEKFKCFKVRVKHGTERIPFS